MNKLFFDRKLYAEGLRQTRLMGIILSAATIGLSVLIPLTQYFQYWSMDEAMRSHVTKSPISIISMAPILILFMYLAPFVLTMLQFGFLNKRSASDYYHSIPNTRTSIYVTFSAVTATWITSVIVISTLLSALLYALCPITSVNLSFIPYTIFTYLAGALLVFAATILGMSITGTGITNFVVTGLILFFPRLISIVFGQVLNSILMITTAADFGIFTDTKYNIVVNILKSVFTGSNSEFLTSIGAIVYTFIVAFVYLGIAWLLFKRRKSETAEKSAPNKVMQHVYRCLITIPVSLIIPSILVTDGLDNTSNFAPLLIVAFISLIIYYAYEVITTKKFSNLLKATPVLLAVIAFDVIFAFSMLLTKQAILDVKPAASEIESVYLNATTENRYQQQFSYNQRLLQSVSFTDETLKQLVSDSLKETVALVEEDKNSFYTYASNNVQKSVKIKTKSGSEFTRSIVFKSDVYKKLEEIKLKSESYVKAATTLPKIGDGTVANFSKLLYADALKLWETYKEEFEALLVTEKMFLNGVAFDTPTGVITSGTEVTSSLDSTLTVTGYHGFEQFYSSFTINSLTPKTLKQAVELLNKESKSEALKILDDIFSTDYPTLNLSIMRLNSDKGGSAYSNIYYTLFNGTPEKTDFTKEEIETINQVIKTAVENPVDQTNLFYLVIGYSVGSNGYSYRDTKYYFSLTAEQDAVLNALAEKFKADGKGEKYAYVG